MEQFFFDGWLTLLRTFVIGILAYVAVVILLRISGKRTLSKMNQFDFIVTVALGSVLAASMVNKEIPLIEGVLALAILIFLQYLITWLSVRKRSVSDLLKSSPVLLLYKGQFLKEEMKEQRITELELISKIRQKGFGSIEEIDAIVLETDSSVSIIPDLNNETVLEGVRNWPTLKKEF